MTPAAGARARRLRGVRQRRLRAAGARPARRRLDRACSRASKPQGVLLREAAARDAPYPAARPRGRPAPAFAGAGRGRRHPPRRRRRRRATRRRCCTGVTGSGKTEVYLEAVAEALAQGRQALVLLPEIALSVEFLDRVEARFGARPAEWHSGVTQAARRRAWAAVAAGEARLVVGARSALFLPFADLGLDRRRRGARRLVQAGGRRPLPRPRHGRAARLDRGRRRRPRLGDAVARVLGQRRRRQIRPARPARALRRRPAAGDARHRPARARRPTRAAGSRRRWPRPCRRGSPPASRRCCS